LLATICGHVLRGQKETMTVHHTGIETGCDAAAEERRGMPDSVKHLRGAELYAKPFRESTNVSVALEHLNRALQSGMKPETQSWVIKAVRELSK
jgi:hypothetical protein